MDLGLALKGEIANLPGAGAGDSGFYRGIRFLARFDAVEEIAHVVDSSVLETSLGENGIAFAHALAINFEAATGEFEGSFRTAELKTSIVNRRNHSSFVANLEAAIAEACEQRIGALPLLKDVTIAHHLGRVRLHGVHGPVDDVDPVGEEIGHSAAAKIPEPAPSPVFLVRKWLGGRGTEPLLPIEQLLIDRFNWPIRLIILIPICADLRDAPDVIALDEFGSALKMPPTALLHAALQNSLRRTNRVDKRFSLVDGMGDRLFKVNIFVRGERVGRHFDVPVIGHGNNHSIQFLIEHLAVIHVSRRVSTARECLQVVEVGRVDVGRRHKLKRSRLLGRMEQGVHTPPDPDSPKLESIVSSPGTGGSRRGQPACHEECAPVGFNLHCIRCYIR